MTVGVVGTGSGPQIVFVCDWTNHPVDDPATVTADIADLMWCSNVGVAFIGGKWYCQEHAQGAA